MGRTWQVRPSLGRAYVFYASEGNWTMYVVRLNKEFTAPETPAVEGRTWARILVRKMREAPAPFKFKGKYGLITSGCTGWKPNSADFAVADHILGPWQSKGNPCTGPDAEITYGAQITCVLPLGDSGRFLVMADRWLPRNLSDSRYVWLPMKFEPSGACQINWRATWNLRHFDGSQPRAAEEN